jgi:DNA-binding SARP family transcriptional activator
VRAPLEEATEGFLRRGDRESARAAAGECALGVVERLDLGTARRWFAALPPAAGDGARLATARLMFAVAREDYGAGVEVAELYRRRGRRAALARSSDRAAALMGLCYAGVGRLDDVEEVFASAWPGPELDAMFYARAGRVPDVPRPTRPSPTNGPFDGLILTGDYLSGHVERLGEEPASPWAGAVSRVWKIGALRARGETAGALELLGQTGGSEGPAQMRFRALVGPELYLDAGRVREARELLVAGRRLATAQGSRFYVALGSVIEAKIALRVDRDTAGAHRCLDRALVADPWSPLVGESADTWRSLAHLRDGDDAAALAVARRGFESMRAGRRLLDRPTAAVHLAEALWRAGQREESEEVAGWALEAAEEVGSRHVLRQALAEFPAVVSRRLAAGAAVDPAWHDLARELLAAKVRVRGTVRDRVHVVEFGEPALLVNGRAARPRLGKAVELLAYLAVAGRRERGRTRVLEEVFGDPSDESARTYLRQTLADLRRILPGTPPLLVDDEPFGSLLDVTTDSARFEADLDSAAGRLKRLEAALRRFDAGDYLPRARSPWVEERRRRIEDRAADARFQAAAAALGDGRLDLARAHNDAVLAADRFREEAWAQRMQVAAVLGDGDAVLVAFSACRDALAEVGRPPAADTMALLEALRR